MKKNICASGLCLFAAAVTAVSLILIAGCGETGIETETALAQSSKPDIERKLKEMGITLSTPPPVVANYVNAVTTGNLVFLAGHGPLKSDGTWMVGRVGRDMEIPEAQKAARLTGINMLSSLKAEIGSLDRVVRIVKVLGMVNSDESFTDQPKVMNGFSDLMVEVFGDKGRHARAAVGMATLPFGIPCEIEMIVEIEGE